MAITGLRLTVTPALLGRRSASLVCPASSWRVAAVDGLADHVVADALAGLAGLILFGLAARLGATGPGGR